MDDGWGKGCPYDSGNHLCISVTGGVQPQTQVSAPRAKRRSFDRRRPRPHRSRRISNVYNWVLMVMKHGDSMGSKRIIRKSTKGTSAWNPYGNQFFVFLFFFAIPGFDHVFGIIAVRVEKWVRISTHSFRLMIVIHVLYNDSPPFGYHYHQIIIIQLSYDHPIIIIKSFFTDYCYTINGFNSVNIWYSHWNNYKYSNGC